MLQVYSKDVAVDVDVPIPFNSTAIQKGFTSTKTSNDTITLNKAGVYMISFDAYVTDNEIMTAQLFVDGVARPEAITSTEVDDLAAFSFTTLVQVNTNNSCRCCDRGVNVQVVNTGVAGTYEHANLVVTKLC